LFSKDQGAFGIFGLHRTFRHADVNENGLLDSAEFLAAMKTIAPAMTAAQLNILFDYFDIDKDGSISFPEFLGALMGVLNDRRKQMVLMAFEVGNKLWMTLPDACQCQGSRIIINNYYDTFL
jgi:calcyphosin